MTETYGPEFGLKIMGLTFFTAAVPCALWAGGIYSIIHCVQGDAGPWTRVGALLFAGSAGAYSAWQGVKYVAGWFLLSLYGECMSEAVKGFARGGP